MKLTKTQYKKLEESMPVTGKPARVLKYKSGGFRLSPGNFHDAP